jgi:hypothetical protein
MSLPTFYKATRPDGTSFTRGMDGTVRWRVGEITRHPLDLPINDRGNASEYLSVSDVASECTGMRWPCRLFVVAPASSRTRVWQPQPSTLPHKHAAAALRVVAERPAHEALGPMGEHVADLIARLGAHGDAARDAAWAAARAAAGAAARAAAWDAAWAAAGAAARDAAWAAARDAAWAAARAAAWDAARDAAWAAARAAARDAAWAAAGLLVRDLISTEHYDALTRVGRTVLGPIHPDDPALS